MASLSDSGRMEVHITSPTEHPRTHARAQAFSSLNNHHSLVTARISPCRKGKQRYICTPTTSPRKQRRRMTPPRDPVEPDDSDDEAEIVVDMPQRAPKADPTKVYPTHAISTSISLYTSSPVSSPLPLQTSTRSMASH